MDAAANINAYDLCMRVLVEAGDDARPLIELANGRETDWLEFKAASGPEPGEAAGPGPKVNLADYRWHVARAVLALANTHGGCLLLGVDDAGRPLGLEASDPKNVRGREGMDAFLRHLDQAVLRPHNGWPCAHAGTIVLEDAPHDLLDLHSAVLDGVASENGKNRTLSWLGSVSHQPSRVEWRSPHAVDTRAGALALKPC